MNSTKEEKLLAALLTRKTVREAAKAAKIPERTAFDMLAKPKFIQRYNELKADVLRGASGEIRDSMVEAAKTIKGIMADTQTPANVRLNAAKTIIESGAKLCETEDIISRITALEEVVSHKK